MLVMLLLVIVAAEPNFWIMAACSAAGAVIGGSFLAAGLREWWRDRMLFLHADGFRDVQAGRQEVFSFDEVNALTYGMTRRYKRDGSYAETIQALVLKPSLSGSRSCPFVLSFQERTGVITDYIEVTPMVRIRDRISVLIAGRMEEQLQRGEVLDWTGKMRVHRSGVEIVDRGILLEWEQISRGDVDQEKFRLWVEQEREPQVEIPTNEANFFPGLVLVNARLRDPKTTAPMSEGSPSRVEDPDVASAECVSLEYANSVQDHIALQHYHRRATPHKRHEWLARVFGIPAVVALPGLILALLIIPLDLDRAMSLALIGMLFGFALYLMPILHITAIDRKRLARELDTAHQLACEGRGPDPFQSCRVLLTPEGFQLQTRSGVEFHSWKRVSRAGSFKSHIFVFLAGNKVDLERVALMIPPRAFVSKEQAEETMAKINEWHGRQAVQSI